MDEQELRRIWSKVGDDMNKCAYPDSRIEEFIGTRSKSIEGKIDQIFIFDIVLKLLIGGTLIWNTYLHWGTSSVILVCLASILLVSSLAYLEIRTRRGFSRIKGPARDTRQNLASMLSFLENRFSVSTWSIASTYVFFFISGVLTYSYLVYGQVRPLDSVDIFVFVVFCLIGVGMNLAVVRSQAKYFAKHLKACLSDLNEDILAVVTNNIKAQRKQDRVMRVWLGLLAVLGFVVFVVVWKQLVG